MRVTPALDAVKSRLHARFGAYSWWRGVGVTECYIGAPPARANEVDHRGCVYTGTMPCVVLLVQRMTPEIERLVPAYDGDVAIVVRAVGDVQALGSASGYACGTANAHLARDPDTGELMCFCDPGYVWEEKGLLGVRHCVPLYQEDPCNKNEPGFSILQCTASGREPYMGDAAFACLQQGGRMANGQCIQVLQTAVPTMPDPDPDKPLEVPPAPPERPDHMPWLLLGGLVAVGAAAAVMFWPKRR